MTTDKGCGDCTPEGNGNCVSGCRERHATGGPVYDVGGFLLSGCVWISNDTDEDEEAEPY